LLGGRLKPEGMVVPDSGLGCRVTDFPGEGAICCGLQGRETSLGRAFFARIPTPFFPYAEASMRRSAHFMELGKALGCPLSDRRLSAPGLRRSCGGGRLGLRIFPRRSPGG